MNNNNRYSTWEVIDLPFQSSFENNPFTDVEFYAIVTGENDEKKVHGFYNGDDEFVIRLSFDQPGEYRYKTYSNLEKINGLEGHLNIQSCEDTTKHGPIVLNEKNSNRLYYQDGTHYNLCAFECDWLFALSYDDQVKMEKTKELIDEIDKNKFNHLVMNVYAFDLQWDHENWERDSRIKPEHDFSASLDFYPFKGNNIEPDFSALNIEYFKHFDNVIKLLDEKNIIAHIMIYVWNKNVNWPEANSDEDNMYFDYVVKRYQAYTNILFDISKEALSYSHCDMGYIVERIERVRNLDAFNRLVTVHDYRFCKEYPELVDIISTQTWVLDIHNEMKKTVAAHPNKVVFNIEHGGYEEGPYQIFTGNYTNPKVCLRRNYEIVFADVYSCYYWQPLAWSVIMLPREAEIAPKFEYYKYMIEFLNKYNYENMVSDDLFGKGGYFMVNKDKSVMLSFIPNENYGITVQGNPEFINHKCQYKFFNTVNGEYSENKEFLFKHHNIFSSPFDEDSVMIIEKID